jgi:hypothetical protein
MMADPQDQFSPEETEHRREAALKRMLQTPHKPHKPTKDSGKSPAKRGRPKKQEK